MAEITTSQIGNGTTLPYSADIVVKDLDLDVSNRVKDDTPVLNMAMSKKRKVKFYFATMDRTTSIVLQQFKHKLKVPQFLQVKQRAINAITWATTHRFSAQLLPLLAQPVRFYNLVATLRHTKR